MLFRGDYLEKRDFIRMAVECPMTFCIQGESEIHHGTAKDLSSSGMSIVCRKEVAEGAVVEVNIQPEKTIVPPLQATCEVVRVSNTGPEEFELGLKITAFKQEETDQA
jgi:hypothetical protein